MSAPLEGIRVLELATFVAAPSCCRLLSDLGAEVIKIESTKGDTWRQTGKSYCSRFSDEENPVFDIYNSGKKYISLNLKSELGIKTFHDLLKNTDVFVTNLRPASLHRLKIAYEDIKDNYPSLVYAIVLGYGEKGPEAKKPAYDTTAYWARSGFLLDLAISNENYTPIIPPSSVGDSVTGILLMGEICAALFRRMKTNAGDYVRSCLYHNGIFTMGTMIITTQKPWGTKFPRTRIDHGVPGGYYQCADNKWIYISIGYAPNVLPALFNAIDQPGLLQDPRFSTSKARYEHKEEVYRIFREAFLLKTSDEWVKIAETFDLSLSKMNHFSDVSDDEQAWANGFLELVEFANGNTDIMPSSPLEMNSLRKLKTIPASPIGWDTETVLRDIGYSDEQITQLKRSDIIRTRNTITTER